LHCVQSTSRDLYSRKFSFHKHQFLFQIQISCLLFAHYFFQWLNVFIGYISEAYSLSFLESHLVDEVIYNGKKELKWLTLECSSIFIGYLINIREICLSFNSIYSYFWYFLLKLLIIVLLNKASDFYIELFFIITIDV
jgi:hypothetical protein